MFHVMNLRARVAVVVVGLLAVAALGTGVAEAATNGTSRPLTGSGTLTGQSDISGNYTVTGTGTQSHVGLAAIEVVGNYVQARSVATVTGADGSTYVSTLVSANLNPSNVCPVIPNTLFGNAPYDVIQSITGGTGRFSGASGSIHTTGCFAVDATTLTLTVTFTDDGTISY